MPYELNTIKDLENLPVTIALVGATMRDSGEGKKCECDHWRVTIGTGKAQFITDYFTGIGHRKPLKSAPQKPQIHIPGRLKSLALDEWEKTYLRPFRPKNASVLHSLVMDAEADGMSFPDWCANYGYSDDSFKAHNIYMACCKIAKDLRQVFTRAEVEKIRELLQDY